MALPVAPFPDPLLLGGFFFGPGTFPRLRCHALDWRAKGRHLAWGCRTVFPVCPHPMHLEPYTRVDGIAFTVFREDLLRRRGQPLSEVRNHVGLTALDYGGLVLRFQDSGRLEEVTARAEVLHLGAVAIPFRDLAAFVRAHDRAAFERASFLVSPLFGIAFVPAEPFWVTALARHCLVEWEALRPTLPSREE